MFLLDILLIVVSGALLVVPSTLGVWWVLSGLGIRFEDSTFTPKC